MATEFLDELLEVGRVGRDGDEGLHAELFRDREEKQDVEDNRAEFIITSYDIGSPTVRIDFDGRCSFRSRPADACSDSRVEWVSKKKNDDSTGVAKGVDHVAAVYESNRWWLCSSDFEGAKHPRLPLHPLSRDCPRSAETGDCPPLKALRCTFSATQALGWGTVPHSPNWGQSPLTCSFRGGDEDVGDDEAAGQGERSQRRGHSCRQADLHVLTEQHRQTAIADAAGDEQQHARHERHGGRDPVSGARRGCSPARPSARQSTRRAPVPVGRRRTRNRRNPANSPRRTSGMSRGRARSSSENPIGATTSAAKCVHGGR